MNVKKQWQHWLLRMEEDLEEVYNTELVARAMMVDGAIYH
jgi:wyosine [tRNA(Phe)-imidazoG37] synthetase (radical SAM superfamily)